ncbi:hypothetical protein CEXT_80661 [Caerostris extrusa]|uniref:Uncharacterized protein n=1 Tax=Caerostris extrusa TaxID=172846 RepID=A0AAV4QD56_CAEEX|nr:hypothetical protein CEXT_80661 [Caerostris extrusa]
MSEPPVISEFNCIDCYRDKKENVDKCEDHTFHHRKIGFTFVCFECLKFVNVAIRIRCYPVYPFQTVFNCAECYAYFTDKLDLLQHASFAAANIKNM